MTLPVITTLRGRYAVLSPLLTSGLDLKRTGHKPWPRTHSGQLEAKRPAMKYENKGNWERTSLLPSPDENI